MKLSIMLMSIRYRVSKYPPIGYPETKFHVGGYHENKSHPAVVLKF
jgi:hypothetical protein